jgi:hypothetical protein
MFQLPVATGSVADGSSNEHPLQLEGVKKGDFRQLLRIMFPEYVFLVMSIMLIIFQLGQYCRRLLREEELSVSQGISVLKLSALWQMDGLTEMLVEKLANVKGQRQAWIGLLQLATVHQLHDARALAIQKISTTFSRRGTDKVVLARRFGVKQWLEEGLLEMVQQSDPFSDEAVEIVGWKTVMKLYRLRERAQPPRSNSSYHNQSAYDVKAGISKEFEKELNDMDHQIEST